MVRKVFICSQPVLAWLGQFDPADQVHAVALLKAMRLVASDEFTSGIRSRLLESARETDGAIALFAEREVGSSGKHPTPLFAQPDSRPRRATGTRADVIANQGEVGSEGLIAQLITELARQRSEKFLNHPGPDLLRLPVAVHGGGTKGLPARKFVLVTDMIGSGNRAWRYLEAAWRVATVKSLWSMRRNAGISFEVVAYATTESGKKLVESHPLRPLVRTVALCPTIEDSLSAEQASEVKSLCVRYDPLSRAKDALGYRNTGALIAFAHGAPNNCPRILWGMTESWTGLFPKRVAAEVRETFGSEVDSEAVNRCLLSMRQRRLADGVDWSTAPEGALERYLVLAALCRTPRTSEVVARRTGLTLLEAEVLLDEALQYEWVDEGLRLTDAGHLQLKRAKSQSRKLSVPEASSLYYPTSLRAPKDSSS